MYLEIIVVGPTGWTAIVGPFKSGNHLNRFRNHCERQLKIEGFNPNAVKFLTQMQLPNDCVPIPHRKFKGFKRSPE